MHRHHHAADPLSQRIAFLDGRVVIRLATPSALINFHRCERLNREQPIVAIYGEIDIAANAAAESATVAVALTAAYTKSLRA
jgi:hypothetical protein